MKNRIIFLVTNLALCVAVNVPAESRVIEYPIIGYANGNILDIARVELNDSVTVLDFNAYFQPNKWIKIISGSYIMAYGKRYSLKSAEGIIPDEKFWMPESGKASFRLIFEPMPIDTQSFDFIEGDVERAFKLGEILIPHASELPERYPTGVPEEMKAEFVDGVMPSPVFESDNTTVRFHLLSSKPDFADNIGFLTRSMFGIVNGTPLKFDKDGNAIFSFHQDGTVMGEVIDMDTSMPYAFITINPGETVDCYIDGRHSGMYAMAHREYIPPLRYSRTMHTGALRNFDMIKSPGEITGNETDYCDILYNMDKPFYNLDSKEYMRFLKDTYDSCLDSISRSGEPEMVKEFQTLGLQNGIAEGLDQYQLEFNYSQCHNLLDGEVPTDSIKALIKHDDYKEVTEWFDLSNPKLLMAGRALSRRPDWNQFGVPGDLSKSCVMLTETLRKALGGDLKQEELDELKKLSNPFFYNVADSVYQDTMRKLSEVKTPDSLKPTPEVADDEVFDAIISQYKGKVVVVDLWNTWCGPCRAAIKHIEPLKANELSSDDIVWVYIADNSSNPIEYLKMISDIRGIHYKLNEVQAKAIHERFNVDGIPYYILVDREGNVEGRPDLRDHSKLIMEIKSKL